MKDKEFIFREVLNQLQGLGCYYDNHRLHDFIVDNKNNHDEFRLGGKFGMGFKIKYNRFKDNIYFTQYIEDTTTDGDIWISNMNTYFTNLCEMY